MSLIVRARGVVRATLVLVVLLVGGMTACGEDDSSSGKDSSGDAARTAASTQASRSLPPPPPPTRTASTRWSTKDWGGKTDNVNGELVLRDRTVIRGWGDPRVRRYLIDLLARIQHDFQRGDMAAVCENVVRPLPPLFYIEVDDDASCETALRIFAQALEKSGFKSSTLKVLWVRAYPAVAGIWVEDPKGMRFRVPFRHKQGKWELELGSTLQPGVLAMRLQPDQG